MPALESRGAEGTSQASLWWELWAGLGSYLRPLLHHNHRPPLQPQKREELFVLQEALRKKRERLQAESPEEEKGLQELAEEIEVLAANIDYINDSITDCQATIVQLEETKVSARLGLVGQRREKWVAGGAPGDGALCVLVLGGAGLHRHIRGHQLLLPG